MRLFSNNIVPYASTEGDKIYPIVVDIKKGIKSGEAISFVTADNQVGIITVDFMDGNSSYSIEGCMVTSTIRRPDGTVLEIPCDIISQSTIEIPLGINGTYQEGTHTFDLKIVRGNGKVIGVPTMSYSVSGSLSSDGVVEGDDRLPVLTMVLDNAQDKLTRLDKAIAGATNDLEVKEARDGEVTLNARLERDLANTNRELEKIKKLEESTVSTITSDKAFTTVVETTQGYFEDVKIEGKTLIACNYIEKRTNRVRFKVKPNTTYTYIMTGSPTISYGVFDKNISFVIQNYELGQINTFNSGDNDEVVVHKSDDYDTDNLGGSFLIEGDHTDKDISYFEGLKSVGQDVEEVNIGSINKNLIDMNVGSWEKGSITNTTGENTTTETRIRMKHFGRLPQNVNYLSFKYFGEYKLAIRFYDMNFRGIDCSNTDYSAFVVTPKIEIPNNAIYYRLVCAKNSGESIEPSEIANCMCCVKLNNVAIMSYIEPKQDKKQILYFKPTTQTWEKPVLREWDSIEKHSDGKYYYYKRSGELVLNGSENWKKSGYTVEGYSGFYIDKPNNFNDKYICDNFTIKPFTDWVGKLASEFICLGGTDINIRILSTKISNQDVAGFKAWLQANNVTIVYQLTKEEVYECTNLDLITYNGETNLIVNSGAIQPRLELKVLSNVSNVVKLLQEKVSVLENKFIEGLKQVLSGNMMALAQLLYPEDFENNHEIQTLEL